MIKINDKNVNDLEKKLSSNQIKNNRHILHYQIGLYYLEEKKDIVSAIPHFTKSKNECPQFYFPYFKLVQECSQNMEILKDIYLKDTVDIDNFKGRNLIVDIKIFKYLSSNYFT
jgi:hypothetical protein